MEAEESGCWCQDETRLCLMLQVAILTMRAAQSWRWLKLSGLDFYHE